MREGPFKNHRASKGFLLCVSIILSLSILEGAARLLSGDMVMFPRYHTSAHYGEYSIRRMRPNSEFQHRSVNGKWKFVINGQGYRNQREFSHEKSAEVYRVLAIGDSHTQGYEVGQNDTFSVVLENFLNRSGIKTEVYNTGVSGYSTAEALVFLEQEGVKYKPDAVVLGFYANDYTDNVVSGLFTVEDGALKPNLYTHLPGVKIQDFIYALPFTQWLSENSWFYSLLFNRTWNFSKAMLRMARKREFIPDESALAVEANHNIYSLTLTEHLLERMAKFCQTHNIILIIADIPQWNKDGSVRSSIKPALLSKLQATTAILLHAPQSFAPFLPPPELGPYGREGNKPLPFHRTCGQLHINPRAHHIIGEAVGWSIRNKLAGYSSR